MKLLSRLTGLLLPALLLTGGTLIGLGGCADSLYSDEPPKASETENNEAPVGSTDHDHAITGTGISLDLEESQPLRLDVSSFDAFQISRDRMAQALDAGQRAAFKDALNQIMMRQYQIDPDLSFDEQWRKQYGNLDGLTAEEIIGAVNRGDSGSPQPTGPGTNLEKGAQTELDADAMREALLSELEELRADIARYHELREGEYPDLARSWSDLTAPIAADGIPAGPLRRHPAVNPFTGSEKFAGTVTDDPNEIGPETAWYYQRATGTIRAVVAYDDAMGSDLVIGKFMPGDTTADIVTC